MMANSPVAWHYLTVTCYFLMADIMDGSSEPWVGVKRLEYLRLWWIDVIVAASVLISNPNLGTDEAVSLHGQQHHGTREVI